MRTIIVQIYLDGDFLGHTSWTIPEALFALTARTMHFNGEARRVKEVLDYWDTAGLSSIQLELESY